MKRANVYNRTQLNIKRNIFGISFSLPVVSFLFVFIFCSIAYCLFMSFYDWSLFDLGASKTYTGFSNYLQMMNDEVFGYALLNTSIITGACLLAETLLGFSIALVLWKIKRPLRIVQAIILLPMITSPVIVGLIWRYIYDPQYGILNWFLHNIGLSTYAWLADEKTALLSVIIVDIWQMTPFTSLILYASMMGISEDLIEAAEVDGAKFWTIVKAIIIPSVIPMLFFILLMRLMDLLKIFDTIYVLTRGGPKYATETLAMYTYKAGFSQYRMGYAMALSIVSLLLILLVAYLVQRLRKNYLKRLD